MKTLRWLAGIVKNKIGRVVLLCLLQGLLVVCGIAFSLLMRTAFDGAASGSLRQFLTGAGWMVIIILSQLLLRMGNRLLEEDTRAVVENTLRLHVFGNILGQDYQKASACHSGAYMNYLTSDVTVVTDGVVTLLPGMTSMLLKIVGVLLVMYRMAPVLALIFLAGGLLLVLCSLVPRKWMKKLHCQVQEAESTVRCYLQECLESLLIIRSFHCEEKVTRTGEEKSEQFRKIRWKRSRMSSLFGTVLSLAMQGGYLLGFAWGGYAVLHGTISYGTLVALIQLIGQIQTPFVNFGSTLPKVASFFASGERLLALTEERDKQQRTAGDRDEIYRHMKALCGENVTFSYGQGKRVLENQSFAVRRGETVAIVGTSGIGKSTLMKLLMNVYLPESGEIYLEADGSLGAENEPETNGSLGAEGELGTDMSRGAGKVRIPVGELPAGMFAYVPQGNQLMSGTIREVVGFAEQSKEILGERVRWALEMACAAEFVEQLPDGYDTVLGEKGSGLSEGQTQRLAVARALYSGCPILMLDEATSALDMETERALVESIKSLEDRTVLLVTHRQEVWKVCDRVIRLGDGA